MRDFSAVTQLAGAPHAVVVHPSLPVKSLKELVALAKARPGVAHYGTCRQAPPPSRRGVTPRTHQANMVRVTYKGGGEAVTAVVAGEISVYVPPLGSVLTFVQRGKLRALAVTTADRVPSCPAFPPWPNPVIPVTRSATGTACWRRPGRRRRSLPSFDRRWSPSSGPGGEQESFRTRLHPCRRRARGVHGIPESEIDKLGRLVKALDLADGRALNPAG